MYEFVSGPLALLAFSVFFVGIIVRTVMYVRGLSWQMDRVAYREHMSYGIKGAARSIIYWMLPYGTQSWRNNPFFTLLVFVLHIGVLITPIFLLGHNILIKASWGFSLPTLSETTADILTIATIAAVVFLVLRRIALPEVRIITTVYDYLLLTIAAAPFVTGILARYQVGNYDFWLTLQRNLYQLLLDF